MHNSNREKILTAAAKILAEEGLDAVSIRSVCKKVGIQAPTVYHFYKSKEGLLSAVIELAYERHSIKYSSLAQNKSPVVALEKIWDTFFEFVENEPELFYAIVVAHLKQRIPEKGLEVFESIAMTFKKLEEKKRLKLPFRKATEIFYAAAYGQALVFISQNRNSKLKKNIIFTRDMCIQNLLS